MMPIQTIVHDLWIQLPQFYLPFDSLLTLGLLGKVTKNVETSYFLKSNLFQNFDKTDNTKSYLDPTKAHSISNESSNIVVSS